MFLASVITGCPNRPRSPPAARRRTSQVRLGSLGYHFARMHRRDASIEVRAKPLHAQLKHAAA